MSDKKFIAPCGAIANSLFNGKINMFSFQCTSMNSCQIFFVFVDTLELFYLQSNGSRTAIPLVKTGIAWWTDKHVKFRNPGGNNDNLSVVFQGK